MGFTDYVSRFRSQLVNSSKYRMSEVEYLDTYWDDLRVSANDVILAGVNPPEWKQVVNDGAGGASYAVQLDGSTQYGTVGDYAGLDVDANGHLTVETWFSADTVTGFRPIVYRSGYVQVQIRNGRIRVAMEGSGFQQTGVVTLSGVTHHLVVVLEKSGSDTNCTVYMDNVVVDSFVFVGTVFGTQTTDLLIGTNGTQYYNGIIDETVLYNVALTASQVTERWNSGAGTQTVPTGVTKASDVIAMFHYDEGTGSTVDNDCTIGAGEDMSLTGSPTWPTGLIGGSAGSVGVLALSFSPTIRNEAFFPTQILHAWKQGSALHPHVHFAPNGAGGSGQMPRFGLEYSLAGIGEVYGNTTTIYTTGVVAGGDTTLVDRKHYLMSFPDIDMSAVANTIGVSAMLLCRFFRDAEHADDTYANDVFFKEFDFHLEHDSPGSRSEYVK